MSPSATLASLENFIIMQEPICVNKFSRETCRKKNDHIW